MSSPQRPSPTSRLDAGAAAIQLSFGDPTPHIPRIHDRGARVICQVHDPEEAVRCVDAGADVVIAQGLESGGHGRPSRGTFTLVPAVVDAVAPTPVVAAGGVSDRRSVAAAIALGAAGVSVGTRLYSTGEAIADAATRSILVEAKATDAVRTEAFDVIRGPEWPEDHEGRAVRNRLTDAWDQADGGPDIERLRDRYRASATDDYSMRPIWAGEGVEQIKAIVTAAEVVSELAGGDHTAPSD